MKTQYYTATSLDGFIADRQHSLDWLFQFQDDATSDYPAFIQAVGAVAMGASTYEWLLRHHFLPGAEKPIDWPYSQPAWVFTSRDLHKLPGDIRFVRGDVRPIHEEMVRAAAGKNVWLIGGGDLVGQFHDQGLLDEIIVTIASVTLGGGAPLLPRAIITPPLELVSVRAYGSAFAQLTYEVQKKTS